MKNILLLLILFILPAQSMEVTFYNIGQGNCTLTTAPGKKAMLLDAGFSKAPANDPGCQKVIKQIVKKIEDSCSDKTMLIVASHADKDHINLMAEIGSKLIEKEFTLEFILGGSKQHYEKKDGEKLITFLKENSKDCFYTFVGSIPEKVRIARLKKRLPDYCQVLSAKADDADINNTSIVIRTLDGGFSTFLSGDATGKITKPIPAAKKKSASVGVQQLSHHGSDTHECTSDALVENIDAKTFIISTGNSGQPLYHPRFDPINSAVKFCIQEDLTDAPYHIITHAHEDSLARRTPKNPDPALIIAPYMSNKTDPNFQRVANYNNGFCAAVTNLPIYSTADSGTITCSADAVSTSNPNNTDTEPSLCALKGINNHNFHLVTHLTLNNMGINSQQLIDYFSKFPENLDYFDLRNNKVGFKGIEHLIKLYKEHGNNLIVKLAHNLKVKKTNLTAICKKKKVKEVTAKNRILATFSKKSVEEDTIESLEFSNGHSGNPPAQHAQAKAYAQDNDSESDDAQSTKVENCIVQSTKTKKRTEKIVVHELSHDKENLYVEPAVNNQRDYHWPGIIDVCLLEDSSQTVAGITTKERSTIFDFSKNEYKKLVGKFRYTDPTKPWKTIGKEFWSLDEPEVPYYHVRSPFSKNGKFVMTVSAKNNCINIYQMDPLSFDSRHVKLHKEISQNDLKKDLSHTIADIKRLEFTDQDHSIKLHFKDKTSAELRYILEPNKI